MPATALHSRLALRPSGPHHWTTTASSSTLDGTFHGLACDLLLPLSSSPFTLSSQFLLRLLDSFLLLHNHLHSLLLHHNDNSRLVPDLLDRSLKTLDLLNALRDGIHHLRRSASLADIASSSPPSQPRRARRALADLTISLLDRTTGDPPSSSPHRNGSFPRRAAPRPRCGPHARSLSWSVSSSWSAARQLHALAAGLCPPSRGGDPLAAAAYTANCVLVLAMWALVAAVPCQHRGGLHAQFPAVPRAFPWAGAVAAIHEKVVDESRGGGRKGSGGGGLLREARAVEAAARLLDGAIELGAEAEERTARAAELRAACEELKGGLDALEGKVREVFHRIARSRMQMLDELGGH